MYDPKHRCFLLSSNLEISDGKIQKGFREYLLCDNCEGKFSVWEKYVSDVFNKEIGLVTQRNGQWLKVQKLDYSKFKLFLLSILWRMSVSSLPMFNEISLGPHESKLALMLNLNDAGQLDDYPCFLTTITHEGKFYPDWILEPDKAKAFGQTIYRMVISGFLYTFMVGSHTPPKDLWTLFPNPSGELLINVEEVRNVAFLFEAWKNLNRSRTIKKQL